MAAHSACAISGGAVTVRRAPPARLRPAGGPTSLARAGASARRRARPLRPLPAPRSPWPALPGLGAADLAGPALGTRTSRPSMTTTKC